MSLTSSSTLTDALAQLNNNLLWEGDSTKAKSFVEAARWLIFNRPRASSDAGTSINYETLQENIEEAEKYIKTVANAANRASFTRGGALFH
jgi:hypothetical protein